VLQDEAVTKLVASAEADSADPTSSLPAPPCRAFPYRRCAAGVWFVPPSRSACKFRNNLGIPDVGNRRRHIVL